MQQQPSDLLSPEKIQLFVAGLSGLAPDEVRKAKVLYLRNAVSEFQAMKASVEAFEGVEGFDQPQGCMSIFFPIFSPMKGVQQAQKRMLAAQLQLGKDRIRNAIDVWRGDLKGERFVVDGEEIVV